MCDKGYFIHVFDNDKNGKPIFMQIIDQLVKTSVEVFMSNWLKGIRFRWLIENRRMNKF